MRKVLMFSVLAVLFLGGATFASAHCGDCGKKADCPRKSAKMDRMFEKKDANSDGVISKAEFMSYVEKKFAKMDADGNGSLTKEEVKNYWTAKKEKHKDSGQCAGK
ncbi:MAG: EF-hand domain-containing protein [Candidatus Dadabacteria bacterium]|nr:EF-hand domain-containing protein [Candidatus Dadabacteria bacterium]MDE0519547.1 EF-hand domain-containing protein [Candidatus Dadabacteria bacterium]MDE0663131.1 EF-hand domain-containing protein [Candidatus Dadabacteria bacterium]